MTGDAIATGECHGVDQCWTPRNSTTVLYPVEYSQSCVTFLSTTGIPSLKYAGAQRFYAGSLKKSTLRKRAVCITALFSQ
jgi:hypothetical protein